jgi:hypothetical protein
VCFGLAAIWSALHCCSHLTAGGIFLNNVTVAQCGGHSALGMLPAIASAAANSTPRAAHGTRAKLPARMARAQATGMIRQSLGLEGWAAGALPSVGNAVACCQLQLPSWAHSDAAGGRETTTHWYAALASAEGAAAAAATSAAALPPKPAQQLAASALAGSAALHPQWAAAAVEAVAPGGGPLAAAVVLDNLTDVELEQVVVSDCWCVCVHVTCVTSNLL